MPHAYLQQLVTPSVAAAQERDGSRTAQARHVERADVPDRLGPDEAEFIAAQDHCMLASAGETGWPYVQHRGGPAGFLRVLDDGAALAWADFRGNRQYVSVGNVAANPKVSLLLLDQTRQARLKVLGKARYSTTRLTRCARRWSCRATPRGSSAWWPSPSPGSTETARSTSRRAGAPASSHRCSRSCSGCERRSPRGDGHEFSAREPASSPPAAASR